MDKGLLHVRCAGCGKVVTGLAKFNRHIGMKQGKCKEKANESQFYSLTEPHAGQSHVGPTARRVMNRDNSPPSSRDSSDEDDSDAPPPDDEWELDGGGGGGEENGHRGGATGDNGGPSLTEWMGRLIEEERRYYHRDGASSCGSDYDNELPEGLSVGLRMDPTLQENEDDWADFRKQWECFNSGHGEIAIVSASATGQPGPIVLVDRIIGQSFLAHNCQANRIPFEMRHLRSSLFPQGTTDPKKGARGKPGSRLWVVNKWYENVGRARTRQQFGPSQVSV